MVGWEWVIICVRRLEGVISRLWTGVVEVDSFIECTHILIDF